MGDLIERAMAEANKCAPPVDDLLRELADELARLRAEVDDYANASKHSADDLRARDAEIARLRAEVEELRTERTNILQSACEATDEVERLRRTNRGLLDRQADDRLMLRNVCAARDKAERERDELRRRIAEAPVAALRFGGPLVFDASLHGKRVALVVLDAEEAK